MHLHRTDEAVETLRRAIELGARHPHVAEPTAGARFALAQALWQRDDEAGALEQANQAKTTYDQLGQKKRAAQVQAWLTAPAR
jgi:hypothetical protein